MSNEPEENEVIISLKDTEDGVSCEAVFKGISEDNIDKAVAPCHLAGAHLMLKFKQLQESGYDFSEIFELEEDEDG